LQCSVTGYTKRDALLAGAFSWARKTMSNDKKQNLQDVFLNSVRKSKTPLTIFLVNGVKLQGVVTWFDNFCVLLRREGQIQLVYKHAISTIMPSQPVQLFEKEEAAEGEGDD
jgi:host factor-I protein